MQSVHFLVPEKLNAGRELKHTRLASHQLIQQWRTRQKKLWEFIVQHGRQQSKAPRLYEKNTAQLHLRDTLTRSCEKRQCISQKAESGGKSKAVVPKIKLF